MSAKKRIKKAINQLSKIENPNDMIKDILDSLKEIVQNENEEKIQSLVNIVENHSLSYKERRDALTKLLEDGNKISFNYEKKNGAVRVVNVEWSDDYTYDIPPDDSDYIFLYDSDDDFFKHFKLDKISMVLVY